MEKVIELGRSRLLVSGALGTRFTNMLESLDPIQGPFDKKVLARVVSRLDGLKNNKYFFEDLRSVERGEQLVAAALREIQPNGNMIHGVNIAELPEPTIENSMGVMEKSVGLLAGAGVRALSDRVFEREFVFLVLGIDSLPSDSEQKKMVDLLGKLSKSTGVIVTGKNDK